MIEISSSSCEKPSEQHHFGGTSRSLFSTRLSELKDEYGEYPPEERVRVKWLHCIRKYIQMHDMQHVFGYLKTANVALVIREIYLRKYIIRWQIRLDQERVRKVWRSFTGKLMRRDQNVYIQKQAKKTKRVRSVLSANTMKKLDFVNPQLDVLAGTLTKSVEPVVNLAPVPKPPPKVEQKTEQKEKSPKKIIKKSSPKKKADELINKVSEEIKEKSVHLSTASKDKEDEEEETNKNDYYGEEEKKSEKSHKSSATPLASEKSSVISANEHRSTASHHKSSSSAVSASESTISKSAQHNSKSSAASAASKSAASDKSSVVKSANDKSSNKDLSNNKNSDVNHKTDSNPSRASKKSKATSASAATAGSQKQKESSSKKIDSSDSYNNIEPASTNERGIEIKDENDNGEQRHPLTTSAMVFHPPDFPLKESPVQRLPESESENSENQVQKRDVELSGNNDDDETDLPVAEENNKIEESDSNNVKKLVQIFAILALIVTFVVVFTGFYVGRTIKLTENRLGQFIGSQTKMTQELSAEVGTLRAATTKLAGAKAEVVKSSLPEPQIEPPIEPPIEPQAEPLDAVIGSNNVVENEI